MSKKGKGKGKKGDEELEEEIRLNLKFYRYDCKGCKNDS